MRNEKKIVITDEGRDKGKVFIVREMPAAKAEKWALKALLIAAKSGVDLDPQVANSGMAGIAALGIQTVLSKSTQFEDVEPLLDEMWNACVSYVPDPNNPGIIRGAGGIGPLLDEDIEEIFTRLHLRAEVLNIHTGFSQAGAPST